MQMSLLESAAKRYLAVVLLNGMLAVVCNAPVIAQTQTEPEVYTEGQTQTQARTEPKVALVLSGGSAFGLAHVGVIRVLEEAGIPIDMVCGTSMGAIVGGLYVAGYSPDQLQAIVTGMDWNAVFVDSKVTATDHYENDKRTGYALRMGFDKTGVALGEGVFSGQNILTLFTKLTLHSLSTRDFDKFPVPFRAVAADIVTGEKVVFSKGSLAEAMRASMSIPGVFRPYTVDGKILVDGGMVDNLPVDLAKEMGADIVIAVESRGYIDTRPEALNNVVAITNRTMNLFIEQNMEPNRKQADIIIKPDLSKYGTMSYSEARQIIEQGEKGARAMMPQIQELASRIAQARNLVKPEEQPNRAALHAPAKVDAIEVQGGNMVEQAFVRGEFASFLNTSPSRDALAQAIDRIYVTGRFDLVKVDLEPDENGKVTLVASLKPAVQLKDAALINYDLTTVLTQRSTIDPEISAGLLFRGWTTANSAAFFKATIGSGVNIYGEYFQPFGPFSVVPWLRFDTDYDDWIFDELKVSTLYRTYGIGFWLEYAISSHQDVRLGLSLESVKETPIPDPELGTPQGSSGTSTSGVSAHLSAVRAAYRFDNRPSAVFPSSGLALLVYASWGSVPLGSDLGFFKLDAVYTMAESIGNDSTIGVSAFFGSDFAGIIPGAAPVPTGQYFSLARNGMFYGMAGGEPEGTGDTVAGIGIEIRHRIGKLNPILGGEFYAIANFSLGTTDWYGEDTINYLPLRWSGTVGAGAKLTNQLGAFAGVGLVGSGSGLRPALTLLIGSFNDAIEDRR